jgi:ATP-binding cassette subfamily B protein
LAKNPEVLILDDCLSAVDASTEKRIEKNLDNIIADKTCIIITHRIFSLMQFDTILVLNDGALAELGTHEALLQKKGLYAEMYENQMKNSNDKES